MTDTRESETEFLLRRAEEESILAIRADQTPAGAAHYSMALRYSARARAALMRIRAGFGIEPAFPAVGGR
ncbi:MAG: hypothetical protein JWO25_2222 [Alphaproteobacteria bacterium]|nr:hypothetical protein [Alphaproteobacteria bacterium]